LVIDERCAKENPAGQPYGIFFGVYERFYCIMSQPMYGCNAAGMRIPSGVWLFSNKAATIRGKANAEPLSVWHNVTFLSSARR
jgi:hypothetical protein